MTRTSLAERIVAIDAALRNVPHAFGGALALAYYAEPRATIDIDINLFVPPDGYGAVAAALTPLGVGCDDPAVVDAVERDGQGRAFWEHTPVDMFFAYDAFHEAARRAVRQVPFADVTIPILAPEHLLVCKVVFDRAKDWVDIDAVLADETPIDAAEVLRWVGRLTGDEDGRYDRIAAVLTRR